MGGPLRESSRRRTGEGHHPALQRHLSAAREPGGNPGTQPLHHRGESKEWSLLFPLAPEVTVAGNGNSLLLKNGDVTVEITASCPIRIRQSRCVRNFKIVPTLCLEISGRGNAELATSFKMA